MDRGGPPYIILWHSHKPHSFFYPITHPPPSNENTTNMSSPSPVPASDPNGSPLTHSPVVAIKIDEQPTAQPQMNSRVDPNQKTSEAERLRGGCLVTNSVSLLPSILNHPLLTTSLAEPVVLLLLILQSALLTASVALRRYLLGATEGLPHRFLISSLVLYSK